MEARIHSAALVKDDDFMRELLEVLQENPAPLLQVALDSVRMACYCTVICRLTVLLAVPPLTVTGTE
jgi:hypothetical protein